MDHRLFSSQEGDGAVADLEESVKLHGELATIIEKATRQNEVRRAPPEEAKRTATQPSLSTRPTREFRGD